uniref:Uncharacterized protein n=1 Tax=Arundo donax TaxID=35708 RepID=A0A0A9GLG6_ARUDO
MSIFQVGSFLQMVRGQISVVHMKRCVRHAELPCIVSAQKGSPQV